MSTTYKVRESDQEFFVFAFAQSIVYVWYGEDPDSIGHLINYGGIVEKFTHDWIRLSGSNFVRKRFEFRVSLQRLSSHT